MFRYQFFAVAHNQFGSSMPSTLLRLTLDKEGKGDSEVGLIYNYD